MKTWPHLLSPNLSMCPNKTFTKLKNYKRECSDTARDGAKQHDRDGVRNSCARGDTLLTLTPEPTVPRLPATVSHRGRLISLPVVLSSAQNTIRNPAGAWALGKNRSY